MFRSILSWRTNVKRCYSCVGLLTATVFFLSPISAHAQSVDPADLGAGVISSAGDQTIEDGFVWHSSGGSSTTYPGDGSSTYRYNPTGEDIVVTRTGVGLYDVTFTSTAYEFHPTVTAYNSVGNYCKIRSYSYPGSSVLLACFDTSGNPVDEEFSMRWTTTKEDAYAWVSAAGNPSGLSHNPWGASPTVVKNSVGSYTVTTLGGPNFQGGHIQVTAYDSSNANYCTAGSWSGTTSNVFCYDSSGSLADSHFTWFRIGSSDDAYAWANEPSNTSTYTTDTYWSHNTQGNIDPTSIKQSDGRYRVEFPGLRQAYGGNVLVTAYQGNSVKCSVVGWGNTGVSVACHDPAGNPKDSRFDVLRTRFITCNEKVVTVDLYEGQTTGPGDDVVSGTDGDDDIRGKAGYDTICGRGGDDYIHGNSDDDWIDGGAGIDFLRGGQGDDVIYAGTGATVGHPSRVFGGTGDDTIYGGPDADDLRGGRGDDTIYGDDGDDEITGNEDKDWIDGEEGNDLVKGGNGDGDELYGSGGIDELNGGSGIDDFCDAGGDAGDTTSGCELF